MDSFYMYIMFFMQEFILELAASDFGACGSSGRSRPRESNQQVRGSRQAAPKINSGATDGGYFIGRPMDPESRPAKTKKAKAESRVKSYGLGWRQAGQGP